MTMVVISAGVYEPWRVDILSLPSLFTFPSLSWPPLHSLSSTTNTEKWSLNSYCASLTVTVTTTFPDPKPIIQKWRGVWAPPYRLKPNCTVTATTSFPDVKLIPKRRRVRAPPQSCLRSYGTAFIRRQLQPQKYRERHWQRAYLRRLTPSAIGKSTETEIRLPLATVHSWYNFAAKT